MLYRPIADLGARPAAIIASLLDPNDDEEIDMLEKMVLDSLHSELWELPPSSSSFMDTTTSTTTTITQRNHDVQNALDSACEGKHDNNGDQNKHEIRRRQVVQKQHHGHINHTTIFTESRLQSTRLGEHIEDPQCIGLPRLSELSESPRASKQETQRDCKHVESTDCTSEVTLGHGYIHTTGAGKINSENMTDMHTLKRFYETWNTSPDASNSLSMLHFYYYFLKNERFTWGLFEDAERLHGL
jgi:hypothetical protein